MRTPITSEALSAASAQLAGKLIAATDQFLQPLRDKFTRVLCVVAQQHGLAPEALTRAGKTRALMAAKRDAVCLAFEFLNPPLGAEALGCWLNLSRSTVHRLRADAIQRAETDPTYLQHLDTLRTQIRAALNQESSNGQR